MSAGGEKELGNIAPGKSSSARFHDYGDSSWIVTVDSRSGGQRITLDSYVNGVVFVPSANAAPALSNVQAIIPALAASSGSKLFARLAAEK